MKIDLKNIKKPIIIAGPCSAETEEQVFNIAEHLSSISKINLFRAGIWKPRTRPGNFEGVGEVGLNWLVNAGKKYNIAVTTEVANAKHVELALKAGVNVLWIGARTTVNPFAVQDIANALKGVNIPILIKNPINPDLQLWVGAIERIADSGINDISAIHRGFSSFDKSIYRNDPKWGIPIELMRLFPNMPIICDPSHIGGTRNLIKPLAQKAFDMNMDGLMIETHLNPDNAWSDAKQQITPFKLNELLNDLIIRQKKSLNSSFLTKLDALRTDIDNVDSNILELLAKRFSIISEIGNYKKINNTTILQPERWFEILNKRKQFGKELNLSEEFIDSLLKTIHKESVKIQTKIMNK